MVVNVHSTHVETKTVLESKNLRVDPGYIGQKKNDPWKTSFAQNTDFYRQVGLGVQVGGP